VVAPSSVGRRGAPLLVALLALALPGTALGQEREARRDTAAAQQDSAAAPDSAAIAPPDSAAIVVPDSAALVVPDSAALPDSVALAEAAALAAQEDSLASRVPAFPARLAIPDSLTAAEVYEWDLEGLLAVPAWSLLDLLTSGVPGMTPLRAGFFAGAHQALDGVFGPGFVVVRRNGRVMPPLQSAQLDLASIPLVTLARVRVIRRSTGLELELDEKRHAAPVAYARLTSATGDPGLQLLRGLFTNGFGSALTIGVGLDLLNATPEQQESNQLHFWGRVDWMPFNNRSGLELVWHNERIERGAGDTLKADRNSLVLRARADITDQFQVELSGSSSGLNVDDASSTGEDSTLVDVDEAALTVRGRFGRGYAHGGGRVANGIAYPNFVGWAEAGYGLAPGLAVEAGGEVGSWDKFSTAFGRLGVAWDLDPGFDLQLRADGAVGTRGLPRPGSRRADSVHFSGFTAGAVEQLGQFRLGQRFAYQSLSRQLPFDAPFDRALVVDIQDVSLPALEVTFSGPIIPVGAIIKGWNPIRLEGYFRRNFLPSGKSLIYTPENLAVGNFSFDQAFISGNLKFHLGLFVVHRGDMLTASPGDPDPQAAGSLTQVGFDFWVGIQSFRLWLRVDDMNRLVVQDVAGIPYPKDRFSIGAKWEFFN
jgi:hypothetical protein